MLHIGLDFDNTIISYDTLFYKAAMAEGWTDESTEETKESVRASVRRLAGNDSWTALQGLVYGSLIADAVFCEGFTDFLEWSKVKKFKLSIVSHKTRFAASDASIDLRRPAGEWIKNNLPGSFEEGKNLFFEETLDEKLLRIKGLSPDFYVDDLEEVLLHRNFPANVKKICYGSGRDKGIRYCASWGLVTEAIEGALNECK